MTSPPASEEAPYLATPGGAESRWVTTSDDLRLRVVHWGPPAPWGAVLLFPGRTEYAEKFGALAGDLAARGLSTLTVDWRGQGLSDRLLADRALGHVGRFADYQRDVAAMVAHAAAERLPRPWFALAHSMGGAIALRTLIEGLDVRAAAFSAPMWGLLMRRRDRPVAWAMTWAARRLGQGGRLVPGQHRTTYILRCTFEENTLTSDRETFERLRIQALADPALTLAGPTLGWLGEALRETRALMRAPAPAVPALTVLGSDEAVVDVAVMRRRMDRWPGGRTVFIEGARHEVLLETPERRRQALDEIVGHFAAHA